MSENSAKLKVEGLKKDVTESQITLVLQNKRRQGGGPIRNIELTRVGETSSAIVTFVESEGNLHF